MIKHTHRVLRCPVAICFTVVMLLSLAGCHTSYDEDAAGKLSMKAVATYIFLLRNAPFFSRLSTSQLRWVVQHSKEWKVSKGSVIEVCVPATVPVTYYWILLDGEWALEQDGAVALAKPSDPRNWFTRSVHNGGSCRLTMVGPGYVMKITRADMQMMLTNGFHFNSPLPDGLNFDRNTSWPAS